VSGNLPNWPSEALRFGGWRPVAFPGSTEGVALDPRRSPSYGMRMNTTGLDWGVAIVIVLIAAGVLVARQLRKAPTTPEVGGIPAPLHERLVSKSLTEKEFTETVAERVRHALPGVDVRIVGPLELTIGSSAGDIRQFLTNAWNVCKDEPAERSRVVSEHVRSVVESYQRTTTSSSLSERSALIPMIKDDAFVKGANEQYGSTDTLAAERLAADVWIVYAVDLPGSIAYLTESERKRLGLPLEELRQLAITNLRRVLPEIERHGTAPAFMLTAGGNMEASLLLLDDLWQGQERLVEGEVVAAVPARDVLVFTGSNSPAGIEAVKGSIQRVAANNSYPVSKALLVRRGGRWQQFQPPPAR